MSVRAQRGICQLVTLVTNSCALVFFLADLLALLQGRLASADKSLSKGELMTMVKFGADEVFKQGADEDITDADIDALLAKVSERRKAHWHGE